MNIIVKTVPNSEIMKRKRFTGADWWWDGDNLEVRVALELEDWREAMALAVHEISEALICKYLGITVEEVDEFDSNFKGEHIVDVNAGDDPKAPYRIPHTFATAIERILTGVLEIDWLPYDERLSKL
jgi:hypothetical protein